MKEKIIAFAEQKGFDIRFVQANRLFLNESGGAGAQVPVDDPREIMAEAKCVMVLFAPYMPSDKQTQGQINVSEYYRVSNASYLAAKEVAGYVEALGVKAVLSWRLNARRTALAAGGMLGKNGFYYHERWGSLVCIHTIVTDRDWGEDYAMDTRKCGSCGICSKACPTGAIGENGVDIKKCLRQYMNETVPREMRVHIYQLFGCEKCQLCCPMNKITEHMPQSFAVEALLSGMHMEELIGLCGKNMARKKRVIAQALLFAGAKQMKETLPVVEIHTNSEFNSVKSHAQWAEKRLKGEL